MMAWIVLVLSGMLEAVWATALGRSEGFTRPAPTVIFALALALSMAGLAWAMRDLPVAVSYAVWVGIGAALTAAWAILVDGEAVNALKMICLFGIVASVIGVRLSS